MGVSFCRAEPRPAPVLRRSLPGDAAGSGRSNPMPGVIVAETVQVGALPGIWSPVQWELGEEERREELEDQARASLLAAVDTPEAVLRLLLDETEIVRAFGPPEGYDPEQQGEGEGSPVDGWALGRQEAAPSGAFDDRRLGAPTGGDGLARVERPDGPIRRRRIHEETAHV